MKQVNVAVLGYGVVGSGVVETILTNSKSIQRKVGRKVWVKRVLDLREFPNDPISEMLTHNFEDIVNDKDIQVVAEVMGGLEPAYTFTKRLLENGKSVVTSNKELVATHGTELYELAQKNNVSYLFEASVGGGIPIIRPIKDCFVADQITEISGILNGTTNYILSKMTDENVSFEDALKEAQDLGYAESDPTNDVEGHDTCRKIAILSSLATGKQVDYKQILTEGITKITKSDIGFAYKLNTTIKLLAIGKMTDEGVLARVSPVLVNKNHPLAVVNYSFNAVYVVGNIVGETMFYGRGAGKMPTASAVVADIVDAILNENKTVACGWSKEEQPLVEVRETETKFFVRFSCTNDLDDACKLGERYFENANIIEGDNYDEFALVTQPIEGNTFWSICDDIKANEKNIVIENVIRMY